MKWNTLKKSIYILGLLLLITNTINAQEIEPELKQLIRKGIQKELSVNTYQIETYKARIDQKLAKSVFIPKITLNGSFTRLDDDIKFDEQTNNLLLATQKLLIKEAIGIPFNTPLPSTVPVKEIPSLQDKNILKSSVDVDWILFSGLKVTNAIKAAKHKEKSLTFLEKAEKDKTALKIIENYDKLALINASESVLKATEKYLNEQYLFVSKAIKNGLATPIDRRKIELAQQQLISKQMEYKRNKELVLNVLQQKTGESLEKLRLLNPKLKLKLPNESKTTKRNEIKALEEAEKATLYKAKMEKSNFIPKVALKGHYEILDDDLSIFDPKWYVGVGVKWNVLDGFESKLKSKKILLDRLKYQKKKENAKEMIQLSIVKANLDFKLANQKIKIAKKEISLSEATYKMVKKQYKNGLASISDVLDAVKDLEKANFDLKQAYFNQRRTAFNVLHANGNLNY